MTQTQLNEADLAALIQPIADSTPDVIDGLAFARLYGEPLFNMPNDLYIPPNALEVFLETFEGPLDLLLYLIRKQNFNVLDIPMAQVTTQYLVYVDQIKQYSLELAAEYLLMAAMLIEIKSRMLLPIKKSDTGEEVDDPRAELVRRLLEYEQMKLAAQGINQLPVLGRDFVAAHAEVDHTVERALPEASRNQDNISMLKADFITHYYSHSDEFTKPYPGISELLKKLSAEGFQLAIASNKIHQATVDLAKRFFGEIRFTAVFGQREGYAVKPNPAILEEIIEIAGVQKSEVLYVGDSGVDVATANNTQVDFTGVLWGFRPRKELEDVGATRFVNTTDELYSIIKSL